MDYVFGWSGGEGGEGGNVKEAPVLPMGRGCGAVRVVPDIKNKERSSCW